MSRTYTWKPSSSLSLDGSSIRWSNRLPFLFARGQFIEHPSKIESFPRLIWQKNKPITNRKDRKESLKLIVKILIFQEENDENAEFLKCSICQTFEFPTGSIHVQHCLQSSLVIQCQAERLQYSICVKKAPEWPARWNCTWSRSRSEPNGTTGTWSRYEEQRHF